MNSSRLILIASMALTPLAGAQSTTPHAQRAEDTPTEVIYRLAEDLGSEQYELREAADASLREIGMPAIAVLRDFYAPDQDYERSLRIQCIAEHVYMWDRVLGSNGFLGISHQDYRNSPYWTPGDRRIDPDEAAFIINQVIPDTAAERAGLQRGDIIVAVDGVHLPADAELTDFADQIREKKPGTEMDFEFWRGAQKKTVAVRIGHRPIEYYARGNTPEDLREQYESAVREFPAWWREKFEKDPIAQADAYPPLDVPCDTPDDE